MKIGNKIRQIREAANLTQKEFADRLGVKRPYITLLENNKRKPSEHLILHICKTFGVKYEWLTGRKRSQEKRYLLSERPFGSNGYSFTEKDVSIGQYPKTVPVFMQFPKGFPDLYTEDIEEDEDKRIYTFIDIPDVPENTFAIIAKDDSMSPTIKKRDYVLFVPLFGIDKNLKHKELAHSDIVIFHDAWEEILIRRYKIKNETVALAPDNPEYPALSDNALEGCRIIGKVIEVVRRIKFR